MTRGTFHLETDAIGDLVASAAYVEALRTYRKNKRQNRAGAFALRTEKLHRVQSSPRFTPSML